MYKFEGKMRNLLNDRFCKTLVFVLIASIAPAVGAEEKIIQQENISFEKCLKVIVTSEEKLSITPKITDVTERKRLAIFTLGDGRLTINCDGVKGQIQVSTNTD